MDYGFSRITAASDMLLDTCIAVWERILIFLDDRELIDRIANNQLLILKNQVGQLPQFYESNEPSFDLHNMTLSVARSFSIFIIDFCVKHKIPSICLVTGSGFHSKNGPVLKPHLEILFNDNDISYLSEKEGGSITVIIPNTSHWALYNQEDSDFSFREDKIKGGSKFKYIHWNPQKQAGLNSRLSKKKYRGKAAAKARRAESSISKRDVEWD